MDRPLPPETPSPGDRDAARDRLRAEVRRLRAENRTLVRLNRLQERFVAMASHEFKTPLTSITAYTETMLARTDASAPARTRDFLEVIRDEAARLLRMVNRILDFSRMEYGSRLLERRPTDLAALARETTQIFAAATAAKLQRLEILAAPHVPRAEVDADLLRQVMVNLVGNATKFTPAGGKVTVTVEESPSCVTVEVADDGPGVPPDELRRIFREFYRAEGAEPGVSGTGLGLSIVRHIVGLHGGQVTVRRRRAGGAAFAFRVPKEVFTAPGEPAGGPAPSLLRGLVRLLADHADSRALVLLAPTDAGRTTELTPLAWTGLPPGASPPSTASWAEGSARDLARALGLAGTEDEEAWLAAPLTGSAGGWVLCGRRCGTGAYGAQDVSQLRVLCRLAAQALSAGARDPDRTVGAIRLLAQVRLRGVPTATPAALDLTDAIARRLGMGPAAAARLLDATALHDAGMARVDDEILHGEGDLDWDARDEIDRHVELGLDLLAPLLPDAETQAVVRHHHERFDGRGHPDGLAGDAIPLGARVLAVVDAWCSLTSERPYRAGLAADAALAEIRRCAGSQFDPAVVTAFAAVLDACGRTFEPSEAGSGAGPVA